MDKTADKGKLGAGGGATAKELRDLCQMLIESNTREEADVLRSKIAQGFYAEAESESSTEQQ